MKKADACIRFFYFRQLKLPAAARSHAATARSHATPAHWRLVGKCYSFRFGALLHFLVMFQTVRLALLVGIEGAHPVAMLGALLFRHQLTAVNLLLITQLSSITITGLVWGIQPGLILGLIAYLVFVSSQGNGCGKYQCAGQR
jgi:hypothetical protein